MPFTWSRNRTGCNAPARRRFLRASPALIAILHTGVAVPDGLRVDDAADVAYVVADVTEISENMGLSKANLADTLASMLGRAGIRARMSDTDRDQAVLFVDLIVEDDAYYVSLDFWRVARIPQPDGAHHSAFVSVWQNYAIGAHHGDEGAIRATLGAIIDGFIARYVDVNYLADPVQMSATR